MANSPLRHGCAARQCLNHSANCCGKSTLEKGVEVTCRRTMLDHIALFRTGLRPPAPVPRARFPGPIALLRVLVQNPLEAWYRDHFERPIVLLKMVGRHAAFTSAQRM